MTGAIMVAFAAAGFWTVGHLQFFAYPTVAQCERDRPRIEADMAAHGQAGIFTQCREAKERTT